MNDTLKKQFELIANKYIDAFVKKQKYEFDGWISDRPGGIAGFISQYFINFDDIRFDIDNEIEAGLIFKWCDEVLQDHYDKPEQQWARINYEHYSKGVRFSDL